VLNYTLVVTEGEFAGKDLFLRSLLSTVLAIGCAVLLFPGHAGLIGVVLAGFGQALTVNALLDRNRDEIWVEKMPPGRANWRLAKSLMAIFLGVFAAYVVALQVTPEDRVDGWFGEQLGNFVGGSLRDIEFGTFRELMIGNTLVLIGSFLFALVYQHAGMLLVLAWNASRWGVVFGYIAHHDNMVFTVVAILPHLVLEAGAYVFAAMGGVFLSRAIRRYEIGSEPFVQVGYAVLRILIGSILCLAIAMLVEAYFTPWFVEILLGGAA
jgi:uncharacterized membrane protein SpoIIM required for sporulation